MCTKKVLSLSRHRPTDSPLTTSGDRSDPPVPWSSFHLTPTHPLPPTSPVMLGRAHTNTHTKGEPSAVSASSSLGKVSRALSGHTLWSLEGPGHLPLFPPVHPRWVFLQKTDSLTGVPGLQLCVVVLLTRTLWTSSPVFVRMDPTKRPSVFPPSFSHFIRLNFLDSDKEDLFSSVFRSHPSTP